LEHIDSVKLLSPVVLLKEVDNLIKNHGEKYFFSSDYYIHKDHRQIFWNIAYYFEILNLPTFPLYIQKDEDELNILIEQLEAIRTTVSNKYTLGSSNNLNSLRNSSNTPCEINSRKQSTASNDASSVYSGTYKSNTTLFLNYSEYYKIIQGKILEKIEIFANNTEPEKMNEDKSEIMSTITEIRSV